MRRTSKTWSEMDELTKPFLPDESVESATAVAIELRSRLVKVEQQALALYTAMASYAMIAQQSVDTARGEARADLDRSQATMIGLIEKLRTEVTARLDGAARRADTIAATAAVVPEDRLAALESQMSTMSTAMDAVRHENVELRRQLSGLVGEQMERDGWLVSSGSADSLTLR
ncbi:unnamed protein product [Phaeothamnion confervicola]